MIEVIKKYGYIKQNIQVTVYDIYNIKCICNTNWHYFRSLDLNKLIPLNNITNNRLSNKELHIYNKMLEYNNCPIKCLEKMLDNNFLSIDKAICNYIKTASNSELLHLLKIIMCIDLSVKNIKKNPQLIIDLLKKQDGNLKETFLHRIRESSNVIVLL